MNFSYAYKEKIIEVKDNIQKLKSADSEYDNYEEKILEKIEEDTSKKIEEIYQNLTNWDSFLLESLNAVYEEAIKRLNVLNDKVTKKYKYCLLIAKQMQEKIKEYENTKKELEDRKLVYSYYDEKIPKIKSEIRQTKKRIRGRKIVLTVNLGLVGGLMAVSFISQLKNIKYKTITTVYDSSTDNISSDIKYLPEAEDTVTVVEYQPWEEYNFFDTQYKRNVYTYELDAVNMNYDDIKDYLTSDFKEDVIPTKEEEKSTSKPNDEYKESEYIITKQIQDKDDYNECDMLSMLFGLMIYSYGGMFWSGFSIGRPSLEELIKILKENKINLKCAKQASLDYKELIEKFYNEVSALKTSIEVDYEKLPIALKENEEIKRKVLAIKEENIEK
jgi:hypothetical protein